jgi:hypothetical protein
MSLRYLDTVEEALGGLETRDIKALKKKVLAVAKSIETLRYTNLARHVSSDEYDVEINTLPDQLRYYANHFIPLILKHHKNVGTRKKPIFRKYMNDLLDYVEASTGGLHYRLICDVLNDLGVEFDEGTLKDWRNQHNGE